MEERPDPPVGPGEVRVAVKATGINFADTMARAGTYPDAPPTPCVVGYEVAGEVESVGEGVEDFEAGDRVLAGTQFGGHAELVTVNAAQVRRLPEELSFEQGAAIPVNYATAYAGARDDGRAARGRSGVDPRGRGRGRHLGHPDRPQHRRRDIRHGVGVEARRDPRAGRRSRDRLPQRRTSSRR